MGAVVFLWPGAPTSTFVILTLHYTAAAVCPFCFLAAVNRTCNAASKDE